MGLAAAVPHAQGQLQLEVVARTDHAQGVCRHHLQALHPGQVLRKAAVGLAQGVAGVHAAASSARANQARRLRLRQQLLLLLLRLRLIQLCVLPRARLGLLALAAALHCER